MTEKFYIDKGNEKQAKEWLATYGYTGVDFPRRRDHLDYRRCRSI